jgi:hypothetical protein
LRISQRIIGGKIYALLKARIVKFTFITAFLIKDLTPIEKTKRFFQYLQKVLMTEIPFETHASGFQVSELGSKIERFHEYLRRTDNRASGSGWEQKL